MPKKPKNQVHSTTAHNRGKVRTGLNPQTATEEICSDALFYITDGHVWLDCVDGNWALVGDKNQESVRTAIYYRTQLQDPALGALTPTSRLATIINRLATDRDKTEPTPQGLPTRMSAIWFIQHDPEQSIER